MALELNETLAAAQDLQSRHPIIELITGQIAADIPFLGDRLTTASADESKPNLIIHSTGRIGSLYRVSGQLYYVYSDLARTEFSYVDLPMGAYSGVVEGTLCELADGNIGIIWITTTQLVRMVIDPEGVVVSAATQVATFDSGTVTSPFVIRLQDDSYLLVYAFNNGGNYEVDKRTSADFLTWSAASDLSIGGLVATNRIDHTSLLQISTGQIWLWFDYLEGLSGDDELVNVYFSTSENNGDSWTSATQFTTYTQYGTGGKHPIAVQDLANQMKVIFYEQYAALHMTKNITGFCTTEAAAGHDMTVTDISLDSVNRKLYCTCTDTAASNKFVSVFRIDIATWTIDACWDDTSVPAFNNFICDLYTNIGNHKNQGDQHLIPVGTCFNSNEIHIDLLDGEADTIQSFHFNDNNDFEIVQNVTWTPIPNAPSHQLAGTFVDHDAQRLYALIIAYSNSFYPGIIIGYFDLTDSSPTKTFVTVVQDTSVSYKYIQSLNLSAWGNFKIYPSADLIILAMQWDLDNEAGVTFWPGRLKVYNLSTGATYKDYTYASFPGFPYHGMREVVYVDGKIYGGFNYDTIFTEEDKRGLCCVDLATDVFTYFRPPWATLDEYGINAINFTDDDRLVINCWGLGTGLFNLTSQTWDATLFNNDEIPGMDPGTYPYRYYPIIFDPDTNLVISGSGWYGSSFHGVVAFSLTGAIRQTKYQEGNFTDSWAWGEATELIVGFADYDAVAAFGGDSLYTFWTKENLDDGINSIFWDKEGSILNLGSFLARSEEIALEWNIDGTPNRLSFAVSHGHLFDPHNNASLLSGYLKKGRKITARIGENISGTEYWQNQGTFYVTELSLSYERKQYPLARIVAEDRRCFWDHKQILVSDYYQTYPEDILSDVLTSELGLVIGDVDLPVFDTRCVVYTQWVETMAKEILELICNRFGHFPKITVDNKFSSGKISNLNAISHVYGDLTQIINFSPDDTYSDFTNQVIITGTERTQIEVMYDEELVGAVNGTIGWWGCKQTYDVYFSNDRARRCRNPRLVILESSSSIGFQLVGQIHESITFIDLQETYCVITVTAPNLIPALIAALGGWAGAHAIPDGVYYGYTIPIGRLVESVFMWAVLLIVGAIGNFQYEVHARPLGLVRRSIQAMADDEDHQVEIGAIVSKKFEESMASTVAELQTVADQELLIAQLQRKRVRFSKIAHLQDEAGDTIQIKHPYTNQDLSIFITSLKRAMKIPENSGGDGYFKDEIEGWRL